LALAKKQLKSSRQFEMPVFEYTALDAKGKTTSGIIDADGARAARQKLRATGIFPVSIKESQEAPEKKTARFGDLSRYLTRVKPAEIAMLTRQLATLISAGFPLVSALEALLPQTKSTRLKTVLAQVKDAIVEGQSFAQALSQYPRIFPPLFINMVRAGETSGTLEIVLERLSDIYVYNRYPRTVCIIDLYCTQHHCYFFGYEPGPADTDSLAHFFEQFLQIVLVGYPYYCCCRRHHPASSQENRKRSICLR
jgi:hypothetical protein